MNELDRKINEHFQGLAVRKDLVKKVKGNAVVPSYVLEYLLGQYCATPDEASIESGVETVKEILRKHYVHRNESELVKSTVKERGRHKIIDKVSVSLNEKKGFYEASFSNLGINGVIVDTDTAKRNPKLFVTGVWCICDLSYHFEEGSHESPWSLDSLKAIQMSNLDMEHFLSARSKFSLNEWVDVLMQSIGFDPSLFGERSKWLQLTRLIPYCERNYNFIELGPKGTGKSHVYSEFSPHGILISGGEVSVAKLFVNNSSGKLGLVGYWDVVAFDEFAGKSKRVDKALVDIMKNYMANKSFSRGVESLGAQASMVFVGNTQNTVPHMLKNSDLFDELPEAYHDSAFLDRMHFYIPGWEMDIIRGEMFSQGYGFVVDYIAEVLLQLRQFDYSNKYQSMFSLSKDLSTRDKDAVHKTFSGLMKLLFPSGEATKSEIEKVLQFAMEGRKRVKDQLIRIDQTYSKVSFAISPLNSSSESKITTLEELEYPTLYYPSAEATENENSSIKTRSEESQTPISHQAKGHVSDATNVDIDAKPGHVVYRENQKGITYSALFSNYLRGAKKIVVTDPYIRLFYQIKNLAEFIELVAELKPEFDEVDLHLITSRDEMRPDSQDEQLSKLRDTGKLVGINFSWEISSDSIHARHIVTDTGWKILLDRGLDIFQPYDTKDALSLANRLQRLRACKQFEITYLKE